MGSWVDGDGGQGLDVGDQEEGAEVVFTFVGRTLKNGTCAVPARLPDIPANGTVGTPQEDQTSTWRSFDVGYCGSLGSRKRC